MGKTKFAIFILSFIVLTIALPYSSKAAPLDYWNWRNPLPQGNTLAKIEYLNGMFIAVGDYGAIVTSPDGANWTARNSLTNMTLWDIAYGNGLFVAVGVAGIIVTSPDGEVWTVRNPAQNAPITIHLLNVSYVNGVFAATGSNYGTAIVYTSVDGINWILTSIDGYHSIGKILSGNGIYVTVGTTRIDGYGAEQVLVSPDGMNWTIAHMPDTFRHAYAMIYANDTFLIWGQSMTYGVWTETVYTSLNGLEWTEQFGDTDGIRDVTFGNGVFVAVRDIGQINTSTNGLYWLDIPAANANGVAYGNGMFAAVGGGGGILTSTDGINWTSHLSRLIAHNLWDIAYGNNIFVAVGIEDPYTTVGNYILASHEGTNWTVISVLSHSLSRIDFLNHTFIAFGFEGDLLTSSDGLNWFNRSTGIMTALYDAAYGNNIFVVVGSDDTILTSHDSISWTRRASGLSVDFNGIVYAEGIFVATGHIPDNSAPPCWFQCAPYSYGTILTSTDGINWTQRYLDTNYSSFSPVEYRNDEFVVVDSMDGTALTSSDGINWTTTSTNIPPTYCVPWEDIGMRGEIHSIAYGNNTFLAVGANGIILQSNFLGGACAATLSSGLALQVPIINFNGTYLWGNADCEVRADDSIMCRVTGYGEANPYAFSDCQPSRLSSDFALQVPSGIYSSIPYRANFEYVPTIDGQMWFKLSSYCPY